MNEYNLDLECDLALKRVMQAVNEKINEYYFEDHLQDVIRFARKYGMYPLYSGSMFNLKYE
jgi:hypothetical protein